MTDQKKKKRKSEDKEKVERRDPVEESVHPKEGESEPLSRPFSEDWDPHEGVHTRTQHDGPQLKRVDPVNSAKGVKGTGPSLNATESPRH